MLLSAIWAVAHGGRPPVGYELLEPDSPAGVQVHLLRVDLSHPAVCLRVKAAPAPEPGSPGNVMLTDPLRLARAANLDWAVNANPWYETSDRWSWPWRPGRAATICGWAVAQEDERSAPRSDYVDFWVCPEGKYHIGTPASRVGQRKPGAVLAVSGYPALVVDGRLATLGSSGERAPRTAMGLDREGKTLFLLVADRGRLAGMPGWRNVMSHHELARLMRDLGCWNAINLDGGASSIMIRRQPTRRHGGANWSVVNRQSRLLRRPLPLLLGVVVADDAGQSD